MGAPKKEDKYHKTERIVIRCTKDEHNHIKKIAESFNMNTSDFIRYAILRIHKEVKDD